ncbi:MAG: hypothetical protein Q9227_004378 [Pyrenula ochraceoflavens]
MPGHYIDTPQTAAGDGTFLTNGITALDGISPEKSFVSPEKDRGAARQLRKGIRNAGLNIKTPRPGQRDPLRLLPNGAGPKTEFTPLMKSVTKTNAMRRVSGRKPGVPETPAFLKDGYKSNGATPALPGMDNSQFYGTTSSSIGENDHSTPMPNGVSSSAHSTPLAQLSARDGNGGVVGDGNVMTLREQENIIDRIEKENFGLKMKIHFLEEAMSQRGPELNQAALRENTDLKVSRITMQRELHKFKKNIAQAERDAEAYRLQLEEYRERMKRKQADESAQVEFERLRAESRTQETEIEKLKIQLQAVQDEKDEDLGQLRDHVTDLEADVREKERQLEEREDEVEELRENAGQGSNAAAELEEQLENARQQIDQLREDLEQAAAETNQAAEEREAAMERQRQAEDQLNELQEDMVNKSFTTKGLSSQLKEKADRLEDEYQHLQDEHARLQQELEEKAQNEQQLQEQLDDLREGGAREEQRFQANLQEAETERDKLRQEFDKMSKDQVVLRDKLQDKTDEKDLLQTRHDALTRESSDLQRDLSKAQARARDLELALDDERHHAAQNDNALQTQHKTEIDFLNEQIDTLHQEVNEKEQQRSSEQEEWDAERRKIESISRRAEEKAVGLQRTVDRLQETKGTLSSKETQLQEALKSEKERHEEDERSLVRQIEELNANIAAKKEASDASRYELSNAKEELRISIREQATLKEKAEQLEEEVEVLQANLEEESEWAERQKAEAVEKVETQLDKTRRERQSLQDQLASANSELHLAMRAVKDAESERDELNARMQSRMEKPSPGRSFQSDQERRELQRQVRNFEKEVEKLNSERISFESANKALEEEILAEIERAAKEEDRLNAEISSLRAKQFSSSENRDRELQTSRSKVQRLESQIRELEDLLEHRPAQTTSPDQAHTSSLRHDLSQARQHEKDSLERENRLKSTTRELKSQISALERQIYELETAKLKTKSPSSSPASDRELRDARKDLRETQTQVHELKTRNRELERQIRDAAVEQDERADLHEFVKSSTAEAETLGLKLAEREERIAELRKEARRYREERVKADQKAQAMGKELDRLQGRYEGVVDKLSAKSKATVNDTRKEKETKGLIREIQWLRARVKREEGFRRDLAWGKGVMEMGEDLRLACNEADIKMIRQMGVKARRSSYETKLSPVSKLRAGVQTVIAIARMQKMAQQWVPIRKLGEGLRKAREDVERRRGNGGRKISAGR